MQRDDKKPTEEQTAKAKQEKEKEKALQRNQKAQAQQKELRELTERQARLEAEKKRKDLQDARDLDKERIQSGKNAFAERDHKKVEEEADENLKKAQAAFEDQKKITRKENQGFKQADFNAWKTRTARDEERQQKENAKVKKEQNLKILVIGDKGVGASLICDKLSSSQKFSQNKTSTQNSDFFVMQTSEVRLNSQITRIPGGVKQEYELNHAQHFNFNRYVIVYSVTDGASYEKAKGLLIKLKEENPHAQFFFVKNKQDLGHQAQIDDAHARKFATEQGATFISMTALKDVVPLSDAIKKSADSAFENRPKGVYGKMIDQIKSEVEGFAKTNTVTFPAGKSFKIDGEEFRITQTYFEILNAIQETEKKEADYHQCFYKIHNVLSNAIKDITKKETQTSFLDSMNPYKRNEENAKEYKSLFDRVDNFKKEREKEHHPQQLRF